MDRFLLRFAIAVVFTLAAAAGAAADTRTLTGEYMSGFQDGERPLEAVFTPDGEERWKVAFYFNFDGRDHTYEGTAEGSLDQGRLEGTVQTENQRRTFTFEGRFEDGSFRGTHAEQRRGGERKTGTLTMRNSPAAR